VISSDLIAMPPDDASKYMSFRKRRSLRLPCYDYSESRPYHVTWGTHDRKRILWREGLARVVIECMEVEAVRAPVNLLAYCVMPDHVHVLLMPRDGANVIRFIQSVKSRTTRAYGSLGGEGKLWQRGFYDHIVRREESISRIAEYIIANPVRAGLAESVPACTFSRSFLPPL
jgi:REP element-mobilizing transposase RayT